MKSIMRFHGSSSMWVAPFALALPLFYYFTGGGRPPEIHFSYAPTIVSYPLSFTYSFAYAIVSALAAWESGRLKRGCVWSLGLARSRYRIAANALVAPVILSWLMLCLPVAVALIETHTAPTVLSLRPLFMAMILCIAHAVIGFCIGLHVPQLITVPMLAIGVWVVVAFSMASEPFWLRHVLGQFGARMMFGEAVPVKALVPHLLFTGGIALGAAALWMRPLPTLARPVVAAALAAGGMGTAISLTNDWGHTPVLLIGQAPMKCQEDIVKVCVPKALADDLPEVHKDAVSVLSDLREVGVDMHPALITDRVADGRLHRRSTDKTWRVDFTQAVLAGGSIRYQVGMEAVRFDCDQPDLATSRKVRLWVSSVIGEAESERQRVAQEVTRFDGQERVERLVGDILKSPSERQAKWFRENVASACIKGS